MARLWSSGFELNSDTEFLTKLGSPTIQGTTVRSGNYALQITSLSSGTPMGYGVKFINGNSQSRYIARAYIRVATRPSAENTFLAFRSSTPSIISKITIDNTGALRLYNGASQVGNASSALNTNTWYRIELIHQSAPFGLGFLVAYIDGVSFAGFDFLTMATGVMELVVGGNLNSESQTTGNWFFDDLAVNNNSGSFQNSLPGPGSIIHMRPDSAGDNAQWTRGGSDSGANWSQVDEESPNDITDYNSSGTAGQIDDFNLAASPAAIGNSDTINLVQVGVRYAASSIGGGSGQTRIKTSSSVDTESISALGSLNGTSFRTNGIPSTAQTSQPYQLTLYNLPGASTDVWTKTALDNTQIGYSKTNTGDAGATLRVSTLWLLVDYTPAVTNNTQNASLLRALAF